MSSSLLTVLVLAVLWLIVVVPMIVRRRDDGASERSVARFGSGLRALTRRPALREVVLTPRGAAAVDLDDEELTPAEVFVPAGRATPVAPASPARRPVPAAREAVMHPVDRQEMSAARHRMMARRRRSLTTLGVGALVSIIAALVTGSGVAWMFVALFLAGLAGYVLFLRGQAIKDRERRATRLQRSVRYAEEESAESDLVEDELPLRPAGRPSAFRAPMETVVRIDDDDIELQVMDTVDLTGLYAGEAGGLEPVARRAG